MPSGATCGWTANSPGLSLPTMNTTDCPLSSEGPVAIPVAQPGTVWAPASSSADWLAPAVNSGASLSDVTEIAKVWGALVSLPPLAVPPSSTACTVTVAAPLASAAGVKVRVPFGWTSGCAANSAAPSLLALKVTDWPLWFGWPRRDAGRPARHARGAGVLERRSGRPRP